MVEVNGTTQSVVHPAATPLLMLHHPQIDNGGGERVRTDDLLRARQALSQLSYTPGKCPNVNPFDPFSATWWAWGDLNLRPHAYQACALTS